ncbi:hypothetical protein HY024_00875 [Candidatus Curtissbacteria bacterium]|nr:hypothetical protein [Candidatus Curtissbacteria bacterium]
MDREHIHSEIKEVILMRSPFVGTLIYHDENWDKWQNDLDREAGLILQTLRNHGGADMYEVARDMAISLFDEAGLFCDGNSFENRGKAASYLLLAGFELGNPIAVNPFSQEIADSLFDLGLLHRDDVAWQERVMLVGTQIRQKVTGGFQPVFSSSIDSILPGGSVEYRPPEKFNLN